MSTALATLSRALLVLLAISTLLGVLAFGAAARDTGGGAVDRQALAQEPRDELSPAQIVDILPVEGLIDPPVARAMLDLIADANDRGSALVVIQLDSEGFVTADLDELLTAFDQSSVPVVVFVGPRGTDARAGGGAAALLFGAHVAAVADDLATVGPLAPIDLGDAPMVAGEQALFDRLLGPDFDRQDVDVLEGVDADGNPVLRAATGNVLLTDTVLARTLQQTGAVDLVVAGLEPLLVELDGRVVATATGDVTLRIRNDEIGVRFHSLGLLRRIQHAATTPTLIYLLLVFGLSMLLFEVFQPGFGVAGFAGAIMVALGGIGVLVLPVAWWGLLLVVAGLGLFALDTAIAGFGPVTIAATGTFVFGSLNLYDSTRLGISGWLVAFATLLVLVFFVVVMTIILRAQAGPDDVAAGDLVGRPGIVRSVLNPEGHVYVDGALWRARWTGDARRARVGTAVRVHGIDGVVVLVEPFDPDAMAGDEAVGVTEQSESAESADRPRGATSPDEVVADA